LIPIFKIIGSSSSCSEAISPIFSVRSLHSSNLIVLFGLATVSLFTFAAPTPAAAEDNKDPFEVEWTELEPGLEEGIYQLTSPAAAIQSEVILLRFSPQKFSFHAAVASDYGAQSSDVITLARKTGAVAAINANFFDPEEKPLGLVIEAGQKRNSLQQGGNLLSGVFYVANGVPAIVHRDKFQGINAEIAIQAGPRLVADSKAVDHQEPQPPSRRSGVAVTSDHRVIFYATRVRFPGATIYQIQRMLLQSSLHITDALNLDGGSSSQLYLQGADGSKEPQLFVTGGDNVPIGLVAKRIEERK
jgi:uncharacterized protein YigE (DUF2233 family)